VEGNDLGWDHAPGQYYYYGLFDYLGCQYLEDGYPSSTGNVSSLQGGAGTVADGFSFGYPYGTSPDHYPSVVGATGKGPVLLQDQDGQGRVACHPEPDYRAVASFIVFGALQNQPGSTKQELMARYLEILIGTPAEDPLDRLEPGLWLGLPKPNPFTAEVSLRYSIAHRAHAIAKVIDLTGRTVAELGNLPDARGTIRWDGTDQHGARVAPGLYIVAVVPHESMRRVVLLR
jgi:hypothetical protein